MKKINTTDLELAKVQDYAAEALDPLERCVLTKGVLIQGIRITAGTAKSVPHGLGRPPFGYIVVDRNANAVVWQSDASLPNKFISLNASANTTVSIWVF